MTCPAPPVSILSDFWLYRSAVDQPTNRSPSCPSQMLFFHIIYMQLSSPAMQKAEHNWAPDNVEKYTATQPNQIISRQAEASMWTQNCLPTPFPNYVT